MYLDICCMATLLIDPIEIFAELLAPRLQYNDKNRNLCEKREQLVENGGRLSDHLEAHGSTYVY